MKTHEVDQFFEWQCAQGSNSCPALTIELSDFQNNTLFPSSSLTFAPQPTSHVGFGSGLHFLIIVSLLQVVAC